MDLTAHILPAERVDPVPNPVLIKMRRDFYISSFNGSRLSRLQQTWLSLRDTTHVVRLRATSCLELRSARLHWLSPGLEK